MAELWQFSGGHPKPAFPEKVQRGDQEKFFKNRPKSSPRLKGPKAAPKVPESSSYGNLDKVTQKVQTGDQTKFSKIA